MSDVTVLDEIFGESNASRERRILLPHPLPSRRLSLLCRTLTSDEIGASWKMSERLARKSDARHKLLHMTNLLALATLEIWRDDEPVCGSNGDPLTFEDDELLARAKVADRMDAVPKVVGRDGDIIVMGDALVEQSGYTDDGYEVGEADPTI